ncbi:MAG: hypothetical protein F6K35_33115, partial [Okeania sp. SIO2H7]|nr:hypothetical protein [Okeania sp. SIO2H7]
MFNATKQISMKRSPTKRKRGQILTDKGLKKVWNAINSTFPDGPSFAAISEYTEPAINPNSNASVSPDSVSKILNQEAKTDKSTIKNLFAAFGLSLTDDDCTFPAEAIATPPQRYIWIPKSRCRKVWGREKF